MSFIRQSLGVLEYLLSTWWMRPVAAACTMLGFFLTGAAFVSVSSLSAGMESMWRLSGRDDVAVIVAQSSLSELNSRLPISIPDLLRQAPGLAVGRSIRPEVVGTTTLLSHGDLRPHSILVRGREVAAERDPHAIVKGRWFRSGTSEVVVGSEVAARMTGVEVGRALMVNGTVLRVVGVRRASGGLEDSEISGDALAMAAALGMSGQWSLVRVKLSAAAAFAPFSRYLDSMPGLGVSAIRESELVERQAAGFRKLIQLPGAVLIGLMALGACLGSVTVLQSAMQRRSREIATLRALGFDAASLGMSTLIESALLAVLGALAGGVLASWLLQGVAVVTSTGMHAIAVHVDTRLTSIIAAVIGAVTVGLAGGIVPALSVLRLRAIDALRISDAA